MEEGGGRDRLEIGTSLAVLADGQQGGRRHYLRELALQAAARKGAEPSLLAGNEPGTDAPLR